MSKHNKGLGGLGGQGSLIQAAVDQDGESRFPVRKSPDGHSSQRDRPEDLPQFLTRTSFCSVALILRFDLSNVIATKAMIWISLSFWKDVISSFESR